MSCASSDERFFRVRTASALRNVFSLLLLPSLLSALAFSFLSVLSPTSGRAKPLTLVFLNGTATPVSFNDGDSFRVQAGPLKGLQSRLEGFNTLESFGPVHRFGTWTPKELYVLAKIATRHAQIGVWHCTSDLKRDTYGRLLWRCDDLAIAQIKEGLAHAMSIDEKPAKESYLAAQKDAIAHRRGMWAHGVPGYIVTSIHAVGESDIFETSTYNRLVSTLDGHSAGWKHAGGYDECQEVCSRERKVDEQALERVVSEVQASTDLSEEVRSMAPELLRTVVRDFLALGFTTELKGHHRAEKALSEWLKIHAAPIAENVPYETGSCGVYVAFDRRYGKGRPWCLR